MIAEARKRSAAQLRWVVYLLLLGLLAGCGRGAGDTASDLQITLRPAPEGAAGTYLTVALADAAGAAITDATVALEGNMNHAGMVPVFAEAVTDAADGAEDGVYKVPFAFTMLGDWIITVKVVKADGTEVSRNIDVVVTQAGVEVAE
jgi:hypothetical protein